MRRPRARSSPPIAAGQGSISGSNWFPLGEGRDQCRPEWRLRGRERTIRASGIIARGASNAGLAVEALLPCKGAKRVAEIVGNAGLARRSARSRPIGVIKG